MIVALTHVISPKTLSILTGSAPSSRSAYSSRDPYASGGRGDRAEKPSYGDPYRSAPSYGGRSAPTDRNGGGAGGRPYSRY